MIVDGSVLAPDTVVPPFAVYSGVPGRHVGDVGEATQAVVEAQVKASRLPPTRT